LALVSRSVTTGIAKPHADHRPGITPILTVPPAQLEARAGDGDAWADAYAAAKIGLYTAAGASPLVFIGFSVGGTPRVASMLRSQPPSQGLDTFFLGAGISSTNDFQPVRWAGCSAAARQPGLSSGHLCPWDDSSVLGVLAEANTSENELARVTRAFRDAAER